MKTRVLLVALLSLGFGAAAQADPITYVATLSGANESTPNASPGTGFATVVVDAIAHTMQVDVTFQDLLGGNTASHIHCCTLNPGLGNVGVATTLPTFTGFPTGVTAGTYSHFFDLTLSSSWNPAFVTAQGGTAAAAEAALLAGLEQGRAYLNIHTNVFPGGEIRGFLEPVPEPATMLLLGSGLVGLSAVRKRLRKS